MSNLILSTNLGFANPLCLSSISTLLKPLSKFVMTILVHKMKRGRLHRKVSEEFRDNGQNKTSKTKIEME